MAMNLDFAETFLDVAKAEIPADMQGKSLVPVLQGKTPDDWRKSVYYHYYEYPGAHSVRKHYGVRTERYKLIHFYEGDVNEWELYDLKEDPNELTNIYSDPGNADLIEDLTGQLRALQDHYGATENTGSAPLA